MSQLPEAPYDVYEQVTPAEARGFLSTGIWDETDSVPLKIVLQDAERAEKAELTRQFVLGWVSAQTLYQSPFQPRYWPGTQSEAASISFFTVATAVNGIVPQVMSGLFYENPPFMVQERPGTDAQLARATSALLAYQLDDMDFRTELKLGIFNCLLFGTSMFQWGWEKFTQERKVIKRKDPIAPIPSGIPGVPDTPLPGGELEEEIIEEVIDRPTFEHIVDLREVLVDPGLRIPDIRKAKYVVRRRYMTWEDLDKLRDRDGYDIPSRENLMMLFMPPEETADPAVGEIGGRNPLWEARAEARWDTTTADPFQKPLEVLERWDNGTYIVVLQKKLVIYNGRNEYGKIPFFSIGWWNIPGGYWSLGLGRTIGSEQRLMTGITNLLLDNASLNLNTPLVRVRGKSIPTQSIRICPGKIIEVDTQGDLEPLKRLPAIPEAGELMAMSQGRADTVSGNNPIMGGNAGSSGHSNLARSSAGAQALAQGASSGIEEFIDNLADQVIVPLLYQIQEMNRALLPESQLQYIMSEELKDEYVKSGGDIIDILNARVKFSILAGSKMQTKRNMAQGLPMLSQFLSNPEITSQLSIEGKKVNVDEVIRMWFEAANFPNMNDVIIPMTPQDIQRQQQQSQGGQLQQKFQAQAALQKQKADAQAEQADADNIARAARDVLREGFKKSVEPEELTGEPSATTGFGSSA